MKNAPQAVIFDIFGVLIADALKVICDELSVSDPAACRQVKGLIQANNRGIISPQESNAEIAAILGISVDEFRARKSQGEVKDGPLMDYIVKTLRPRYKTAILSNIALPSLQRRFTPEELARGFDVVVASGETGYIKPEIEIYQLTADRLQIEAADCIFVDDREHFCEGARAAGMQAICYQNFPQFKRDLEAIINQ